MILPKIAVRVGKVMIREIVLVLSIIKVNFEESRETDLSIIIIAEELD